MLLLDEDFERIVAGISNTTAELLRFVGDLSCNRLVWDEFVFAMLLLLLLLLGADTAGCGGIRYVGD